jgi:hypothetical protein
MRSLKMVTTCFALAACGSSNVQDRASAFAGRWQGQGVGETFLVPVAPGSVPVGPLVTTGLMDVASRKPDLVQISPLPFFGVIVPVEMQVADDSSLVGVPFTSAPVAVTCPSDVAATCATVMVTLEGGSGTLSGGLLAVSLHGQYTQCCSTQRFVYGFMGVRR